MAFVGGCPALLPARAPVGGLVARPSAAPRPRRAPTRPPPPTAVAARSDAEPTAVVEHRVGASTSRRPARMVVEHAKSLDRFYARRYPKPIARLLRPFVRLGLAAWVGLVLA